MHKEHGSANRYSSGFTLLEVMIALAIFALVAVTAAKHIPMQTRYTEQLASKTQAIWLAQNAVNTFKLQATALRPQIKVTTIEEYQQRWAVKLTLEPTRDENLFMLNTTVAKASSPEETLFTLVSYVGKHSLCCTNPDSP